jgi:exopolysaccharide biosynthesis polyprenyl glycosylphosphotransferase
VTTHARSGWKRDSAPQAGDLGAGRWLRREGTPLFVVPDALAGALPHRGPGPRVRRYLTGYLRWLRLSDLLVITFAVLVAQVARFGFADAALTAPHLPDGVTYALVSAGLVLGWMAMLHLHNAYDGRLTGHGIQEYRQVLTASMWLFGVLAIVGFALKMDFARGYVLLAFPLGTVLLLGARWRSRKWLVRQRARGRLCDRVLLVGDREHVEQLVDAMGRTPAAGYRVLGACVSDADGETVAGVPVVGPQSDVLVQSVLLGVDVIAVSSSAGLGASGLRRLGWALEGSDIDLVVAPEIMDVAGPRVLTRPVHGLPLIHVEAPRFGGPQRVLKSGMDRAVALTGLVLLLPVLLLVALAVRLDDGGPVFFRQERVGRDGGTFRMVKFRTMVPDAEARLPALLQVNEGSGPLFKLRADPRVTRIGAWLRRYSLDEVPQLLNVLRGEMSLVGPRPPLPREVAEYESAARRRLLVKPGMTGLWQISGRSELPWEEAVRLDLYYVENWTPLLDLMIMWRTMAVVRSGARAGAY